MHHLSLFLAYHPHAGSNIYNTTSCVVSFFKQLREDMDESKIVSCLKHLHDFFFS